jgi:hypothetical protein
VGAVNWIDGGCMAGICGSAGHSPMNGVHGPDGTFSLFPSRRESIEMPLKDRTPSAYPSFILKVAACQCPTFLELRHRLHDEPKRR